MWLTRETYGVVREYVERFDVPDDATGAKWVLSLLDVRIEGAR